jgi:hypothetical protein
LNSAAKGTLATDFYNSTSSGGFAILRNFLKIIVKRLRFYNELFKWKLTTFKRVKIAQDCKSSAALSRSAAVSSIPNPLPLLNPKFPVPSKPFLFALVLLKNATHGFKTH